MHATSMVITPIDKSLDDNLMKYCENVEEGDGSGPELIYYSNEEWDVTPGDTVEELIENYKKETGEDMDPTEYHVHNLNGYYDWYMVGGRWSGFFKSVENPSERANLGEKSWTKNKKEIPTDRIDYGLVSDIDWKGMSKELLEKVTPAFEVVWKALEDVPATGLWNWDGRDSSHPKYQAVEKLAEESDLVREYKSWILLDNGYLLGLPLERALKELASEAFSTYSIVHDGEWYDKNDFDKPIGNRISEIIKEIYSKGEEDQYMVYLVDYHS